ncbi:MAG: FxsA family protein, partial [Eikenella corrodens]
MRYLGIWLLLLAGAEAASIVMVAERLGGMPTLLLMVLSFMVGMVMLRNLGFSSVMLAGSLFNNQGEVSFYQLLWPLRYIVAALLLMSPGFVSTALALVLMLPIKGG